MIEPSLMPQNAVVHLFKGGFLSHCTEHQGSDAETDVPRGLVDLTLVAQ